MSLVMGPILGFRGRESDEWRVYAPWVAEGESPAFSWSTGGDPSNSPEPQSLKTLGGRAAYCVDWAVRMLEAEQEATYRPGEKLWTFAVPPKVARPRFAYASCNGFSDPKPSEKSTTRTSCGMTWPANTLTARTICF